MRRAGEPASGDFSFCSPNQGFRGPHSPSGVLLSSNPGSAACSGGCGDPHTCWGGDRSSTSNADGGRGRRDAGPCAAGTTETTTPKQKRDGHEGRIQQKGCLHVRPGLTRDRCQPRPDGAFRHVTGVSPAIRNRRGSRMPARASAGGGARGNLFNPRAKSSVRRAQLSAYRWRR